MNAITKPLSEISEEAIRLLFRELGIVKIPRFLNQFAAGYGNYTEEPKLLFDGFSVEEIATEIKESGKKT